LFCSASVWRDSATRHGTVSVEGRDLISSMLESQGFRVNREVHRFEFHTGEAKLPSFDERWLIFKLRIARVAGANHPAVSFDDPGLEKARQAAQAAVHY
jgi:hypothetical protein